MFNVKQRRECCWLNAPSYIVYENAVHCRLRDQIRYCYLNAPSSIVYEKAAWGHSSQNAESQPGNAIQHNRQTLSCPCRRIP